MGLFLKFGQWFQRYITAVFVSRKLRVFLLNSMIKITVVQWSLTVATAFVTTEKLCWMVTMTGYIRCNNFLIILQLLLKQYVRSCSNHANLENKQNVWQNTSVFPNLCNIPVVDFGACLTSLIIDCQHFKILLLVNLDDCHRR